MKLNNFRGDLPDISAKKEPLVYTRLGKSHSREVVCFRAPDLYKLSRLAYTALSDESRVGVEQYTWDLAAMFTGLNKGKTMPEIAEAVCCLMQSLEGRVSHHKKWLVCSAEYSEIWKGVDWIL